MKRLKKFKRDSLIRLTMERTRRRERREFYRTLEQQFNNSFFRLHAPHVFAVTFDKDIRKKVLSFIDRLREVYGTKKKVLINFTDTHHMYTCGTLLFYAELRNMINSRKSNCVVRIKESKNQKVMQVLKQIGVLSLLQHSNTINPSYDDVVRWRFTTGNNVLGAEYENILNALDDDFDRKTREGLFKAFSEAMTNTHQHAYIEIPKERSVANHKESWWAFSQIRDGMLHIVFCDLGIGIPGSLPKVRPDWIKDIMAKVPGVPGDGEIIKGAIRVSRTRTGLDHRGKGLNQLIDAIKDIDAGYLSILSRKGGYRFEHNEERTHNYRDSICGTLIEWKLPLPKKIMATS